jgi:hypothetical protein
MKHLKMKEMKVSYERRQRKRLLFLFLFLFLFPFPFSSTCTMVSAMPACTTIFFYLYIRRFRCSKYPSYPRNRCASISGRNLRRYKHRSRGNSASAAPAPTLLSATQQWPTSKHDAATKSCCWMSPMLQASQLPPKQVHRQFWRIVRRYSIAHAVIQRPQHRCSL